MFTWLLASSSLAFNYPQRNHYLPGFCHRVAGAGVAYPFMVTSLDGKSDAKVEFEESRRSRAQTIPDREVKHRTRKKKAKKRLRKEMVKAFRENLTESQEIANTIAIDYSRAVKGARSSKARRRMLDKYKIQHNDRSNHLKMLERHPTLVLNADYQPLSHMPLSIWTWQEAIKSIFSGKVTVVDTYPDVKIRAVNVDIPLPSVIVLNEYVSHTTRQRPAFTRRNVFLRDGYRCQYCNNIFRTNDLSLDHVVPRCRGGALNWDNAVTCCRKCNCKKGHLRVSELKSVGMKLIKEPYTPTAFELASEAGKLIPRKVHPTWAPFLGSGYITTTHSATRQFEAVNKSVE